MIGKKLGKYELVEKLGEGGMGEVYRAHDTELGRDVAVKVLPQSISRSRERLDAFRQEARTLAGIQHPNIATIYGLDSSLGVEFFVQELVPGETLAERLRRGRLDRDEVLSIGKQVADALDTAHAAGVVHRDLKPDNVMLAPDGAVKVLDFGLAAPAVENGEHAEPLPAGDSTPTVTDIQPADHVIVGTPAYMSPDQARGRKLDQRGDIWALGCMLYEMLAGQKAFDGETLLDKLSAIVRVEPDWEALPDDIPPRLEELIRLCLRKRLRDRLQSAGDVRILIEQIELDDERHRSAPATPSPRSAGAIGILVAATAVLAAAAGWLGARSLAPPTTSEAPLHAALGLPEGARLVVDTAVGVAVSPDGRRVAYTAVTDGATRLHLQSLDSYAVTTVPVEDVNNPFFSPDGSWVGFFVQNQRLVKMPVEGGATFEITRVPTGNWGATWLPDDTIVYAHAFTGAGLMRVPAAGGEPALVYRADQAAGERGPARPQALPDGRILFTSLRESGPVAAVLDLETGEARDVLPGASDARWTDTGHLLFSRGTELFAIDFDLETLSTSGAPVPLLQGLFVDRQAGEARFDLGRYGALVYVPAGDSTGGNRLVWVARDGSILEPLAMEPGDYGHPKISPDGRAVAVDRSEANRGDIWVYDMERRNSTRITREGDNRMPVWQPDAHRVAFASNLGGSTGIWWVNADGSGERHPLLQAEYSLWPRAWRDRAIVYYELNPDSGRDIWAVTGLDEAAASGSAEPMPVVRTAANERAPALSPDGRWIAYVSDESGRDEVYVQAFGGDPARVTVSNEGGREPVWSRDGSELFYRVGDRMMAVPVRAGETFEAGAPELLFEGVFDADRMGSNQYFDVDLDGQRFLMIRPVEDGSRDHLRIISGFANRLHELARER